MIDDLLPHGCLDYIAQVSQDEHPELKQLREYTFNNIKNPQMCCGPVVANVLQMLIKISGAKQCLEIGSYTGYSALAMALSLPQSGQLITLEKDTLHSQTARLHFEKSSVANKITLIEGPALESISKINTKFDFIFIDADKVNYPHYFDQTLPMLEKQGLMVVDNALYDFEVLNPKGAQARAIDALNIKAKTSTEVETLLMPIRDGLMLIRKI